MTPDTVLLSLFLSAFFGLSPVLLSGPNSLCSHQGCVQQEIYLLKVLFSNLLWNQLLKKEKKTHWESVPQAIGLLWATKKSDSLHALHFQSRSSYYFFFFIKLFHGSASLFLIHCSTHCNLVSVPGNSNENSPEF